MIDPEAAPTAIAITPTSSAFIRNCIAIATPINNGMNDENSVKIADKSSAHCAVPNIFKMYFITADGKTPIKIPWAEPESTLKKKSFNFSSYEPSKNSLVIILNYTFQTKRLSHQIVTHLANLTTSNELFEGG